MSQESPEEQPVEEPAASPTGIWRRPLAYLLILAGVLVTFFNSEIGRGLGISTLIIQIAALVLLLAGAALFYSVRQRVDRVTSYRQAFTRLDAPEDPSTEETSPSNLPKDKE